MNTFFETLFDGYGQEFEINRLLFEQKTDHQHLVVFENTRFGRVMALDGIIQTTEADEYFYHEMLVHVPVIAHGEARDVLIIGGGDGGSLREVLKHKCVERVTLVEIDRQVIDISRELLPGHSQGGFENSRLNLIINDGLKFVQETNLRFDVIISDCTDNIGPGKALFSEKFYHGCRRCLRPEGIFVAQNGVPFFQPDQLLETSRKLPAYFQSSTFYCVPVPTYVGGFMALAWATDKPELQETDISLLTRRYQDTGVVTRYYTPPVHRAAFALPKYMLSILNLQ